MAALIGHRFSHGDCKQNYGVRVGVSHLDHCFGHCGCLDSLSSVVKVFVLVRFRYVSRLVIIVDSSASLSAHRFPYKFCTRYLLTWYFGFPGKLKNVSLVTSNQYLKS